jgi:hypothetical protein
VPARPETSEALQARAESARVVVDRHLRDALAAHPALRHVSWDPQRRCWYVRFAAEARDATTVVLELRQRSLWVELGFLPLPADPERRGRLAEWLLRRNHHRFGPQFSVDDEDLVCATARIPLEHVDEVVLDRLLGACLELVERWFPAAVTVAFGLQAADRAPATTRRPGDTDAPD